jgi:hypothetical protein
MHLDDLLRARRECRNVQHHLRAIANSDPEMAERAGMLLQRCEDADSALYGILLGLYVMLGDQQAGALLTLERDSEAVEPV